MGVDTNPGFSLSPAPEKVTLASNYITDFDFLNQYLPDTYEKEFERYGNRSVSGFLRMVGAEMPSTSDLIKWSETGRLHMKFTGCTTGAADTATSADWSVPAPADSPQGTSQTIGLRVGQTVFLSDDASGTIFNHGVITGITYGAAGAASTVTIAYYEATQAAGMFASTSVTIFAYGSEFGKGENGMTVGTQAIPNIFENKPIIIKEKFEVNGSDMAQIGWVEVTSENGATGYLWYIQSEHETRLRFDDYLETAMLEAVPAAAGSGAATNGTTGSEGVFYVVEDRGNVFSGSPTTLQDFDDVVSRLDKQGAIEENVLFVNRSLSFDIDDMLAAQNSYGAGGTSYGLFDNDETMALNLGFSGFRRGYDFYKSDWKYLNDATMRGGLVGGAINGLLVPAGSTNVYDQILGKNAKRPFLHVRYRASETEDRRYKTWITGSAGGARTSSLDAMEVHFLSERAVCVLGANNFFLFK